MHADTITFGESVATGVFPNVTTVSKLGYVTNVNETEVDIWAYGGKFTFPSTAQQMEVVSSSANDAAAGTGVRTVKIYYLDSTFTPKTETVTLNGTTAVATKATDIYRINAFWAITAGAGGKAAGNIDVRATTDTPVYSRIPTGYTRARHSAYTVPVGKRLFVSQVTYSSSSATGKDSRFSFRANYNNLDGAAATLFYAYSEIGIQDTTFTIKYDIPMVFPAGTDILVSVISVAGSAATCSVQYRGWIMQ